MRAKILDEPGTVNVTRVLDDLVRTYYANLRRRSLWIGGFCVLFSPVDLEHRDTTAAFVKMRSLSVLNIAPFSGDLRGSRVVESGVTGSERVLLSGAGCRACSRGRAQQRERVLPGRMPTMYPGALATALSPLRTADRVWLIFSVLSSSKTSDINGTRSCALPPS